MRHSSPVANERTTEKRNAESPNNQRNSLNGLDQLLKSSASTHLKLTSKRWNMGFKIFQYL